MASYLPDPGAGITLDALNRIRTNPESVSYLQSTHFQFTIQRIPNFVFYCQSVNIPDISSTPLEQPVTRFKTPIPHPGENFEFGQLSVSFLVDEYMKSWLEIHDWMRSIKAVDGYQDYEDPSTHYSDASIIVHNNTQTPIVAVRFRDIFPISLSELPFNSSDTTPEPLTATATFAYNVYDIEKLPAYR